jgi:hypothetical protein
MNITNVAAIVLPWKLISPEKSPAVSLDYVLSAVALDILRADR